MSNAYRSTLAGGGTAVGDATAADVLTGKTFSGAVGSGVAGTMPNQGAVSGTATPSQPYTIPAGYHNGSGVVTASGGTLTATAVSITGTGASQVLAVTEGKYYALTTTPSYVADSLVQVVQSVESSSGQSNCTILEAVGTGNTSLNGKAWGTQAIEMSIT